MEIQKGVDETHHRKKKVADETPHSPGTISRLFTALSEWGISAQQIPDDLMAKQVL